MKNPEKQFFKARQLIRQSAVLVLDKKFGLSWKCLNPSNRLLYNQAKKMQEEAEEEMGKQNKRKIKL